MILLSGSSNIPFAKNVAKRMGLTLGDVELSTFKNGERRVYIKEKVKGHDVGLIQSFSEPSDAYIVEFALMTDALFRQGARRVFAVVPWFAYSLQDKVHRPGEPIASKVIASMLSSQSIYRFILMNLHNPSISGFFSVPSSVLSSDETFGDDIKAIKGDVVIVSSDFGGLKRVGKVADMLHLPIANIDKVRDLSSGEVQARAVTGAAIEGKICVVLDDLINGGGTSVEAARILKENGAKEVKIYATHALLAGDASENLQNSEDIDEVVVTDTIDTSMKSFDKLRVVSVADVFADELTQWTR
jgi:ribose-phosphate pyrophosphokinase